MYPSYNCAESIVEFEEIAEDLNHLRNHLVDRLYVQGYGDATHQGLIKIDVEDEYYLEEDRDRWEKELDEIYDPYDMVEYALREDPRNEEAGIWEEFLG